VDLNLDSNVVYAILAAVVAVVLIINVCTLINNRQLKEQEQDTWSTKEQ
jgi:hypothetical protein